MVTAVVVAAFEGSCKSFVEGTAHIFGVVDDRTATVLGMASGVEPRISVTTAVDAVELEGGILHHGVDLVGDDECTGNVVADLDAETRICRDALRNVTDHDGAGLTLNVDLVTLLVVRGGVCTRDNRPVRSCGRTGRTERTHELGGKRLTVNIDDFEVGGVTDIIELAFRVFFEVTGLVHTNRRHAVVDSVQIGLVQSIWNQGVWSVCCRSQILRQHVLFLSDGCIKVLENGRIPG